MSDLHQGETMTALYQFISAGTAHTFTFPFQPDKVVFNNLTQWSATAGNLPVSVWWRNQTASAHASQMKVTDTAAAQSFNFIDQATNGFTVADTEGGVPAFRALIAGVTQADPCVITTTAPNSFQTNQIIRITDLGSDMPVVRGMDQLNNNRYSITVLSTTTFSLQDPVTGEDIDSTGFAAWVAGGRIDVESRVISLNNPQQPPYSVIPYIPNPFQYDPVLYKLLVGTAVMGANSDVFNIEVYKFGEVVDLGDLVV